MPSIFDRFASPCRPPPDKTKDKEGVSLNRTPLNQRSRGQAPPPPPPPEHSDEEEEEEGEEVGLDTGSKHILHMVKPQLRTSSCSC
jgi:hypothetical protein